MTTEKVERIPKQEPEETVPPPAESSADAESKPADQYDFHIRLHGIDIDETLKDAATVAYRLGLITKPTMAQLMSLYIAWGLALLKQQWLDHVGYH